MSPSAVNLAVKINDHRLSSSYKEIFKQSLADGPGWPWLWGKWDLCNAPGKSPSLAVRQCFQKGSIVKIHRYSQKGWIKRQDPRSLKYSYRSSSSPQLKIEKKAKCMSLETHIKLKYNGKPWCCSGVTLSQEYSDFQRDQGSREKPLSWVKGSQPGSGSLEFSIQ